MVTTEESEESPQRRKLKPETLDEFNNSWGEMENESPRKPYHRRRVSPVYVSDIENDNVDVNPVSAVLHVDEFPEEKMEEPIKPVRVYEKVRDPFTALLEVDAKARLKKKQQELETKESEMTTVSDLKMLLKQSVGSISLSEILQQKNLSLGDLLQGKGQAISALTEKPEDMPEIKEYRNPVEDYPQVNQWKVIDEPLYLNRQKPKYPSVSDSVETIDIKNTSDIPKSKYSKPPRFSSIKNFDVVNEPTTERRIFVPSHPKYYTSATYKPKLNRTETTITTTTTEKPPTARPSITRKPFYENKYLDFRSKYVSMKPKLKNPLPITSAKLNNVNNKEENETTQIPLKAFTIDLEDIFGFSKISNQTEFTNSISVKADEGPMKMDFDLNSLMRKVEIQKITTSTTTTNRVPITEYASKKIKPSNAREEISEILRDNKSRNNLTKILRLRNMTVEELVAQRERGSSQLHLADIFHNQTREPEPPVEPLVGHVRLANDRKPKTMLDKTVNSSNDQVKVTNFPKYKIELDKVTKESEASPSELLIWKSLYPTPNPKNYSKIEDIIDDVKRIEDIENSISDAVNNEFNVELDEDDYENKTFFKFPLGVKSAIIASAAIIGISCSVFLTIFIIFKWNQKQRQRLCYTDSFSCSRIKSPILESIPKRTIKTIMSETLGRKRKYSNVYPQSMSDYMWENDKKTPFQ